MRASGGSVTRTAHRLGIPLSPMKSKLAKISSVRWSRDKLQMQHCETSPVKGRSRRGALPLTPSEDAAARRIAIARAWMWSGLFRRRAQLTRPFSAMPFRLQGRASAVSSLLVSRGLL